ncbi:MAG: Gfo/Idh/MocA family oxidoreductase [Clostridia bacterium]|nr:Gfo/Idh/MocA family oxidoreductase [Clostridia bacterium]
MSKADGMRYAPKGVARPVVGEGEFVFAATALRHGHIYGMVNGLLEAGATLGWVYDTDPAELERFCAAFPQARIARGLDEILSDRRVRLVAAADVPNARAPLGLAVMDAGKDYFTDKTPFTTLEQVEAVRAKAGQTGQKYMVYFSERLHSEAAVHIGHLVRDGEIGRVLQVIGLGPHRLSAPTRPGWFFNREQYGGILCDIGSHQIEQFLYFTGAKDAMVSHSQVANYNHPAYPELEDFGDAMLLADNGATHYFRVDWFTPDGLGAWGDGRLFLLGTKGYIEARKYIDPGLDSGGDIVLCVNGEAERLASVAGKVGFPFFGEMVLDCLNRTEKAMTQEHILTAGRLCIEAQMMARKLQ